MSQHNTRGRSGHETSRGHGQQKRLAEMHSDETGRIEVIGDEVRDRLVSMGIRPGKHLVIHAKQPFRGPITVSVGKNVTSLSHDHARQIEITIEDS